jgi:hypothetical protein
LTVVVAVVLHKVVLVLQVHHHLTAVLVQPILVLEVTVGLAQVVRLVVLAVAVLSSSVISQHPQQHKVLTVSATGGSSAVSGDYTGVVVYVDWHGVGDGGCAFVG